MGGLAWTWFLVDDTPHESLARAEDVYDEEEEKPGEVEALEETVVKAIELGVVTPTEDGAYVRACVRVCISLHGIFPLPSPSPWIIIHVF